MLSGLLLLAAGLFWNKHRAPAQLPIARAATVAPRADELERQRALVRSVMDHAAHFLPGEAPPPHVVEREEEYTRHSYLRDYAPRMLDVVSPEMSFLEAVYNAAAEQGLAPEEARATLAAFVTRVRSGAPGASLDPALACFSAQDFAGAERLALAATALGERAGAEVSPGTSFLQVIADSGRGLRQSIPQLRAAWVLAGDAQVLQSKYWEAMTSFRAAARLVSRNDFASWLEVQWRLAQVASFDEARSRGTAWREIAAACASKKGAEDRLTLAAESWAVSEVERRGDPDPDLANFWSIDERKMKILAVRQRSLGPDDLDVARSLFHVTSHQANQSLAPALEALAIRERCLAPDHPEILRNLRRVVTLYGPEKKEEFLALRAARRALAMSERLFGPAHPEVANDAETLALYLQGRGSAAGRDAGSAVATQALSPALLAEVETLQRRVAAIREKQFGWDAPEARRGRADPEVRRSLQQHLAAAEKEHGEDHLATVRARFAWESWLAEPSNRPGTDREALFLSNRPEGDREALFLSARATLSTCDRSLGEAPEDVPNLADRLLLSRAQQQSLVTLLQMANPEVAEAEHLAYRKLEATGRVLKTKVEQAERLLGPWHPDVADHLADYAGLLGEWKKPREAEPLDRRAFEIRLRAFGPGDWRVVSSLQQLYEGQKAGGRLAEAEALARWMLEYQEKWPEDRPADEAERLTELAGIVLEAGKLAEVEPLLRRSLARWNAARRKIVEPKEVRAAIQLADFLRVQGRAADAVLLYRQALAWVEKDAWDATKFSLSFKLGESLGDLGQFAEATERIEEASTLLVRDRFAKPLEAVGREGVLLAQQGKFTEARALLAPAVAEMTEYLARPERVTSPAPPSPAAQGVPPALAEFRRKEAELEPFARMIKYLALADAALAPVKQAAPALVKRK